MTDAPVPSASPPSPRRPPGAEPWRGEAPPPAPPRASVAGRIRAVLRGAGVVLVLLVGVLCLLPLRLVERLFTGPRRPVTGPLVQAVCRLCLLIMGLRWRRVGQPMRGMGAAVANHASWLDIFVLNAAMPVFFVSKAEVARWPGINILTRVTNTQFVIRDPRLTQVQAQGFAARIRAGHRLLFFPEATTTDSRRVLPFRAGLFQGVLDPALPEGLAVQPISVHYQAPARRDPRFYSWYGDMTLGPHTLAMLAQSPHGSVTVTLHPPIPVAGHDRKSLAAACEAAVRSAAPDDA